MRAVHRPEASVDAKAAQAIVNAYGMTLAEPTALGLIRDARSLPYSKEEIKHALKIALQLTSDPAMREQLRMGYVSLADFQELSEREVTSLRLWNAALNAPASDSLDLAKSLAANAEVVTAVQRRVVDEAALLLQELKETGF